MPKKENSKHLEEELLLQREINQELEKVIHQSLMQSKKDENLINELVLINELFNKELKKLNTKNKVLSNIIKHLKSKLNPDGLEENNSGLNRVDRARNDAGMQKKKHLQYTPLKKPNAASRKDEKHRSLKP